MGDSLQGNTSAPARTGHDDYALERVPQDARHSWWSMTVQRFGQLSSLAQFLLGATLGFGMEFLDALIAITIGALILEAVAVLTGIIGQREGLTTSVLARWLGFGRIGSALIGLVIAVCATGWFGIQSGLSAEGLVSLVGWLPTWAWALVFGLAVTVIVVYGFSSMAWTAYITVPAMLLLAGWSIVTELSRHSLGDLVTSAPAGPVLSLVEGATLVTGSFIIGGVIAPDMCRFNRTPADVVKQTVIGFALGEYGIAVVGVLLAHALRSADIVHIVTSTSGFIGALVVITATLKINDWNLYTSSLCVTNFAEVVFGRKLSRVSATIGLGVVGSVLAAAGILNHFTDYLILLGVAFPPIAGIMIAEYYVVRAFAGELQSGAKSGVMPSGCPRWVPATLAVWLAASLVGNYVTWGLAPVNALIAAFVLYVALGKLGLVRAAGRDTVQVAEPATATTSG